MSFLSGLKVFGKDIVKVFGWFGSPMGKAEIATGEAVVSAFVPGATPIINLFNKWAQKAYNIESLAAAAGKAQGTGLDKAALMDQAIAADILQYAQEDGLSPRTADQIKRGNDAVIAFINAMTEENPATSPASNQP